MKTVQLSIHNEILQNYPETKVGYIAVSGLTNINLSLVSNSLTNLPNDGITKYQLNLQNLSEFPTIKRWREIYRNCGVKPKTYKSSIESLLRRFIQKKYTPIIPIVDTYNYISAYYALSAGGYNIDAIHSSLTLRYANENENFVPLGNIKGITISQNHIVYADENEDDSIVCWQWNHKDSKRTMLTPEVDHALFIFDCTSNDEIDRLNDMLDFFEITMMNANVEVQKKGILSIENDTISI